MPICKLVPYGFKTFKKFPSKCLLSVPQISIMCTNNLIDLICFMRHLMIVYNWLKRYIVPSLQGRFIIFSNAIDLKREAKCIDNFCIVQV